MVSNLVNVTDNAPFEFGVAMLPAKKTRGAPTGGGNFYRFKDSTDEQKQAAVDFVKWITAPAQSAKWTIATGYVAPRPETWELPVMQLMIMPDILLVENYTTMRQLGLVDTIFAIGLPYMGSAFAIFLLRQTFMTIPKELNEVARIEGANTLTLLKRVYVPLAKPTYLAFGLISVSAHWNNFLWPLIITNSVETRPLTVGLSVFAATDSGVEWSVINAATLMTSAPLLIAFLLFQRQFVQSFMRAGIK